MHAAAHATAAGLAPPRLPIQPTLLGVDEPPAVPEVKLAIIGQVQRPAELRVSPNGQPHLVVTLAQPPHGGHARRPIVAVYHGAPAEVAAFEALAHRLHIGALAMLMCRGLDVDAERNALRAWHCDSVTAFPPEEAATFALDRDLDASGAAVAQPRAA